MNTWLLEVLGQMDIIIDDIKYCPHHPDDGCDCRKPKIGMLIEAQAKHGIDLSRSFFVGDMVSDMKAGRNAGCITILIRDESNYRNDGAEQYADYVVAGLAEAADIINSSE